MDQSVPEYWYASLPPGVAPWYHFIVVLYLLHGGNYGATPEWSRLSAWDCSNAKTRLQQDQLQQDQ